MRIVPLYIAIREDCPLSNATAYHALSGIFLSEEMSVEAVNEVLPVDGTERGVVQHAALEAMVG